MMLDENIDENGKAFEINQFMDFMLTDKHEKSARKNETYLLNNSDFNQTIKSVRSRLGITNTTVKDDGAALEYGPIEIQQNSNNLDYTEAQKRFDDEIVKVLTEFKLPDNWRDYIGVLIVNNQPPGLNLLSAIPEIRVIKVKNNGEITLVLKPGLRREDYLNAWKAFAPHLGTANQLEKAYSDPELDMQMYQEKKAGATYEEIAKKHFLKQYENSRDTAIDKVKKRISRLDKRLSAGQN
jgi:hypothetical protein